MTAIGFLAVFIGGGVGSILRYGISLLIPYTAGEGFPKATFLANIIACSLLGIGLANLQTADPKTKLLLLTGLCGGFSTFSTFSAETIHLLDNNQYLTALLYVLMSNLIGFICFYACYKFL